LQIVKLVKVLEKFRQYSIQKLTKKQKTYIISIVIGFFVGVGAVLIKKAVHFTQWVLTSSFPDEIEKYLYFIYPIIGIFLAVLYMNFIIKKKESIILILRQMTNKRRITFLQSTFKW